MTKFAKFVETIEENFAIDVVIERGELNPYCGTVEIIEAGETVAKFAFEEDPWGEGDEYDESYLRATHVSSTISDGLLNFLEDNPMTEGVVKEWKEDLKYQFILKGWHVK